MLFNFTLECLIMKVQETNLELHMDGTHQVLFYADDVNLIGDDIKIIERNAYTSVHEAMGCGQKSFKLVWRCL